MENRIQKLKELTNNLPEIPTLSDIVTSVDKINHTVEYSDTYGNSTGRSLLDKEECAVQDLYISKGTPFPPHAHVDELEHIVVYSGKVEVVLKDKTVTLNPGDHIKFNKKEVHSGVALEDSSMLAIAIPRIQGYPK